MSTSHLVIDPAIRCEIEALIVEHSWMLDNHKSDGLGELYVEDGRLTGIGPDRIGRAAIEAYGRDRAKMAVRKARHVNTNIRLVKDGPKRIRSLCTITLFRHDGDTMGTADPVALADAEDVFVHCDDGRWRFEERRLVLTFESAAHRS
ncbi:MAG: nuclear transport factor 2 family protein [Xanthobacteraceae bacterium]|nr:nuclear transport factor 2 family protein [Xanthobacteraceae bacterium]